ncbi:1-aminocyclopropane-1-carboxylate synthase [Pleurostoma richardsiae]|uniref:1-aminocyclopropane-1-carboxylate synthase n=1 Tax=Pleurostoma richardsiae TaxID=41990 RepID=A0AA38VTG7_9PEZI|nr:1-aminocyclopropane-1-carboxylate synthase [Pleurostoma richardsiae]
MLSRRGALLASQLDIPWRFVPKGAGDYDPDTNQAGVISYALAENALIRDEIESFTADKVRIPGLAFTYGYSRAGGPRLPKATAVHLNEYFSPVEPLTGEEILFAGGTTAVNEVLGFSIGEPGDGILTSVPCYGRFELDFGNKAGLKMIYAETDAVSSFLPSVVDKFETALVRSHEAGVRICALLIVNPNNPVGKCYPRDTLLALMRFCHKHQIHFISDEVYGLSVFESGEGDAVPFTSALSIDFPAHRDFIHVTWGFSKDFGAAGMRLGALITRNRALRQAMTAIVRFHGTSGMAVAVAVAMLEDREWCRSLISVSQARLGEAYQFTTRRLRELGIPYVKGANAGFFIFLDMSRYLPPPGSLTPAEREFALVEKLMEAGIFLQPGEEHYLEPGWFRMVYTQNRRIMEEGFRRLAIAVRNISW